MSSGSAAKCAGALASLALVAVTACNRTPPDPSKEGPSAVTVQPDADPALVQVLNPAAFPLVAAASYEAPTTLNVTGTVNPNVSRTIPVISIASGRVVAVHARLGDSVKKGQLLIKEGGYVVGRSEAGPLGLGRGCGIGKGGRDAR